MKQYRDSNASIREKDKIYRETHRDEYKQYRDKNKDKIRTQEDNWRATHKEYLKKYNHEYQISHRAQVTAYAKKRRAEMKRIVMEHYSHGTMACACCGVNIPQFLSIDHMNNDGKEHRKMLNTTSNSRLHLWLIKNNFPEGFQVLCHNCNHGRYLNGGTCPHKLAPQ